MTLTMLCNHGLCLGPEHFITAKKAPCPSSSHPTHCSFPPVPRWGLTPQTAYFGYIIEAESHNMWRLCLASLTEHSVFNVSDFYWMPAMC